VHNNNAQQVTSNGGEGVWETLTELGNSANIVVHNICIRRQQLLEKEMLTTG
jgi:hypothetical protein